MRSRIGLAVVAALAVAGTTTAVAVTQDGQESAVPVVAETRTPAEELRQPPGEAMLAQRLGTGVPEDAFQRAEAQELRMASVAQPLRAAAAPRQATRWVSRGPDNIGGRLVDVVQHPTRPRTLFVGAASGGVWRTVDGGRTFDQAWPIRRTQAIGALAIGPDGTLWAGTGEANPGGGSTTFAGDGMYRSSNGGRSWQYVGLGDVARFADIVVDPRDPDRVLAAATGDLFRPGGERGLYSTTDGGQTWQRLLTGENGTSGAADVTLDPNNSRVVYTTFWDHTRTPEARRYGGPGSRVYKSRNGGRSWTELGNGLPEPSATTGRMGIAVAPTDSDRLYVIHVDNLGLFEGFYISDDAGRSWERSPDSPLLANSQSSYGWWFGRVWVSPDDADDVWVPGVPLVRSRDGGQTWGYGAGNDVHVDHHGLIWDYRDPEKLYLGNDGGFYRSDDDGASWTKARSEPYTQYYTVDVGEQDPSKLVGGAQDNGCSRSYGEPEGWNVFACGDGLETLIAPDDDRYVYACSQYGSCRRSADGGDTTQSITGTVSDQRNWKTPIEFDPNDPRVMYYAGNVVNRSTDRGATWTAISPDLGSPTSPDPQYPYGTVTTVAPSATDPDRLYAGTDDARVWTTANGGDTWRRVDDGLPGRWVTRLRVDPENDRLVYATLSGFRNGDAAAHVFRSRNAGRTWTNVSGNLPNAPVNDVVLHDDQLYVANDLGVFLSEDDGRTWSRFGAGLPNTPMTELRVHEPSNALVVASFGRGMYVARMPAA